MRETYPASNYLPGNGRQLGEAHRIAILHCDRCIDATSVRGHFETRCDP